jgi:hypothetical protein
MPRASRNRSSRGNFPAWKGSRKGFGKEENEQGIVSKGRPKPAAEAAGVVAGTEVVVAGFGVAFFTFEFVRIGRRATVGIGVLATVGIEVGVVANGAGVLGDDAGGAEEVFGVVFGIAACGKQCNTLAAEENVFVQRGS